ncbi:hypothetical protein EG832_17495, partial [bacterium]|nr:hypothetical protein [bacterium]
MRRIKISTQMDNNGNKIIFWGATGQAKVLREIVERSGKKLVAVFDNNREVPSPFRDVPLLFGKQGFEAWKREQGTDTRIDFLVAIGGERGKDRVDIH